ncbi:MULTISPECIES: hypothetical protein [unclassified Caballeronia]|uniref:hypothetical protein n=1 Tax=unclassified Caballeronia TaxID=2646786 RepID=UPI0020299EBF|nr:MULTISPECIES: hypothetical protein [unclassified Caballeronia]
MERSYPYRGFEITIHLEPVKAVSHEAKFSDPVGFIAVVSVCTAEPKRPVGVPVRLVSETHTVFRTEDEALSSGLSAAQRIIDAKIPS